MNLRAGFVCNRTSVSFSLNPIRRNSEKSVVSEKSIGISTPGFYFTHGQNSPERMEGELTRIRSGRVGAGGESHIFVVSASAVAEA